MAKVSINLATGSIQKEELIVGIDLGTTNSLVAFINPDINPQVINDTGKGVYWFLLSSILEYAGDITVGNEAKAYLIPPNRKIPFFRLSDLLGRSYKDIENYKDFFSATR